MPQLTDEERVAQVIGDVEPTKDGDETIDDPSKPIDQEEEQDVEEPAKESSEEEKPKEDVPEPDESAASTFTKQFPNLKGETPEEYLPELEKAYDNSFKEALRLNDVIKERDKTIQDNAALIAQANQIVAQGRPAADASAGTVPAQPSAPLPPSSLETNPEIEWIKGERRRVMMTAFDSFKEEYPQVLDPQEFERFRLATDGVKLSLTASTGKAPTDSEVFTSVAGIFGWQPAAKQDKKDAAIKENASSSRVPSGQSSTSKRPPKVSDAQVDAYMKMYTSKTREEAVKELSEVV